MFKKNSAFENSSFAFFPRAKDGLTKGRSFFTISVSKFWHAFFLLFPKQNFSYCLPVL